MKKKRGLILLLSFLIATTTFFPSIPSLHAEEWKTRDTMMLTAGSIQFGLLVFAIIGAMKKKPRQNVSPTYIPAPMPDMNPAGTEMPAWSELQTLETTP
ncbi:MAG: hypothetical protein R3A11_05485 [Bdellovibrionota bacterium]